MCIIQDRYILLNKSFILELSSILKIKKISLNIILLIRIFSSIKNVHNKILQLERLLY